MTVVSRVKSRLLELEEVNRVGPDQTMPEIRYVSQPDHPYSPLTVRAFDNKLLHNFRGQNNMGNFSNPSNIYGDHLYDMVFESN